MKKYNVTKTFTFEGRRYFIHGDSEQDVAVKIALKKRDISQGHYTVSENPTLSDWFEVYLNTYKTSQIEITRRTFSNRVHHCILSKIGDLPIKSIKPIHIQNVMNEQAGKSKTQVNEVFRALKSLFKYAKINHLIVEDPTESLIKPKYKETNVRRALTPYEREIVSTVGKTDRRYYFYLLMLFCGCRPSEASECKGMDISFDEIPMLHIRGTKTVKSDRMVPIPPDFYELIKDTQPFEYIACMSTGNKITPSKQIKVWKSFRRQINIAMGCKLYRNKVVPPEPIAPDLVPYCFRHEYCTDLARHGVDIRVAQKLMGHSNINMTANIYTNLNDEDLAGALDYLFRTPGRFSKNL